MEQEASIQDDFTQELEDNIAVTKHSVVLNGQSIEYTATAGTFVLREVIRAIGVKEVNTGLMI